MSRDMTPQEEIIPIEAWSALKAVLLFHSGSPWDESKRKEWLELTALCLGTPTEEATTRVLCDMARAAIGRAKEVSGAQ